jgi:hypothetical protein
LLGGKVDRPAASVLISDNFVHFLDLVAFGLIPSGVCIIAPFTTQSTLIIALFTISFPINDPASAGRVAVSYLTLV